MSQFWKTVQKFETYAEGITVQVYIWDTLSFVAAFI